MQSQAGKGGTYTYTNVVNCCMQSQAGKGGTYTYNNVVSCCMQSQAGRDEGAEGHKRLA